MYGTREEEGESAHLLLQLLPESLREHDQLMHNSIQSVIGRAVQDTIFESAVEPLIRHCRVERRVPPDNLLISFYTSSDCSPFKRRPCLQLLHVPHEIALELIPFIIGQRVENRGQEFVELLLVLSLRHETNRVGDLLSFRLVEARERLLHSIINGLER